MTFPPRAYFLLVLPYNLNFLVSSAGAQGMVRATLWVAFLRVLAVLCQCHWVRVRVGGQKRLFPEKKKGPSGPSAWLHRGLTL